jgi:hypothetical protein
VIEPLWISCDFVLDGTAKATAAKGGLCHGMSAESMMME